MPTTQIHLIVEKGADKGREIIVSPEGVRIGRSSKNDIVLRDPALSRFHCRIYFKPNDGLWAADLGSANQTLLNEKPLVESRLHVEDRLTIGSTLIKVLHDQPFPASPTKLFDSVVKSAPADSASQGKTSGKTLKYFWKLLSFAFIALVIAATLMALILIQKHTFSSPEPTPAATESSAPVLEIYYEKVQAGPQNIFRYEMELKNGEICVQIDDLKSNRHVPNNQHKKIETKLITSLIETIKGSGFFDLKESYRGLASDVWDVWDLSITIGKKTHHVQIFNCVEPEEFRPIREAIEEFGQNELGLAALAMSPEKLLDMAREASQLGRTLYDQREVRDDNLFNAIHALKETEWYLETIQPKPDFYKDAVALRADCERELQTIYDNHRFLADRAIKLRDWAEAAKQLRTICTRITDASDERHKNAQVKLIDVERHLKK